MTPRIDFSYNRLGSLQPRRTTPWIRPKPFPRPYCRLLLRISFGGNNGLSTGSCPISCGLTAVSTWRFTTSRSWTPARTSWKSPAVPTAVRLHPYLRQPRHGSASAAHPDPFAARPSRLGLGMTRYLYNRQVRPPAPFVYVSSRCPDSGQAMDNVPAQIDTAADRTVIPGSLVDLLQLVPLDEFRVTGLGGQETFLSTYAVDPTFHTPAPQYVEVFAHDNEPYILLGRDVLNRHRLLFDGPGLVLVIG